MHRVEYPESPNAAEARLALAVAQTVAPFPEDLELPRSSWPVPRCTETLPLFEQIAAAEPPDEWSSIALGFKALCLSQTASDRREEIREAATVFLEAENTESTYTYERMLRSELKIALWRIDGLPEFEAQALAGGTLSLADFKGKVTLLDFWNPG